VTERPRQLWDTDAEREAFRSTFDEDADAYDRSRPVAPSHVFDDAAQLAHLTTGSRVLEIGPGTGQATRQLAERGLRVRALELGPSLAERARRNLAEFSDVDVVTSSFESWAAGGERFDAVFACNSFHWVDHAVRFAKPAELLADGGHLVVLATPWVTPDDADPFWWDVQDDYVAVGGEYVDPATNHPDLIGDLAPLIRKSGYYEEPETRRFRFDVKFTADGYATNLSTQSGFKAFDEPAQTELLSRVRHRIEARGGTITAHLLAILTVAKVKPAEMPAR
jgi:protein-L-isoaspartate O-methyltransferase